MGYSRNPLNPQALREQAAFRLSHRGLSDFASLTAAQAQQLLEDLEIQQIELELQNGYLNAAREALEKSLNQSNQLYDFSPVGSLSLDASGSISRLNLAAASLLGGERAHLQGSQLVFFVAEADRPRFGALMERARVSGEVQGGEVLLTRGTLLSTRVQIRLAPLPQDPGWHVVLLDLPERLQNEEHLRLAKGSCPR